MDGDETLETSGGRFGDARGSAALIVATLLDDILPIVLAARDGGEPSCCDGDECCEGDSVRAPKPKEFLRLKRLEALVPVLCSRGDPVIEPEDADMRLSRYSSCPNGCWGMPPSLMCSGDQLAGAKASSALFVGLIGADTNRLAVDILSLSAGLIVTTEEEEMESAPVETRRLSSCGR